MSVLVAPFPDGEIGVTVTDSALPAVTTNDLGVTVASVDDPDVYVSGPAESSLLAEFDVLYRAENFTGVDGDPWLNEGTAGSGYDAIAATPSDEQNPTGFPHYVTSPSPGFEITSANVAYYYVPDGPSIEPGTGSFTAFGRAYWPSGAGSFDNYFAKINTTGGQMGSGGKGWQIGSGSALGDTTRGIVGPVPVAGTAAFATATGNLASGEHLLVLRVDRDATPDTMDLFIDGVLLGTGDVSTVPDVTAVHPWIFGRGKTQTNRAYGLIMRALTNTEVTATLPGALYT